jgi:hypothetical protein
VFVLPDSAAPGFVAPRRIRSVRQASFILQRGSRPGFAFVMITAAEAVRAQRHRTPSSRLKHRWKVSFLNLSIEKSVYFFSIVHFLAEFLWKKVEPEKLVGGVWDHTSHGELGG